MTALGFLVIAVAIAVLASVANNSWADVWSKLRTPEWWAQQQTSASSTGSAIAPNPSPGTTNILAPDTVQGPGSQPTA